MIEPSYLVLFAETFLERIAQKLCGLHALLEGFALCVSSPFWREIELAMGTRVN